MDDNGDHRRRVERSFVRDKGHSMLRYLALAVDFDGTIARDGCVDPGQPLDALGRVEASGRHLILATGRQFEDLPNTCTILIFLIASLLKMAQLSTVQLHARCGSWLTHLPPNRKRSCGLKAWRRLPPDGSSSRRGGRMYISRIAVIRELGLEHHVVFNKGAVMVLPPGAALQGALALPRPWHELGPQCCGRWRRRERPGDARSG